MPNDASFFLCTVSHREQVAISEQIMIMSRSMNCNCAKANMHRLQHNRDLGPTDKQLVIL